MTKQHENVSNVQKTALERHLALYTYDNVEDDKTPPQIHIEKSPFEKHYNDKAPRGSENLQTLVSQDMFEDFMKFAGHFNVEHHNPPKIRKGEKQHNKSSPLKHIINEFLNSHALERQCFNDLYVIMAFEIDDFKPRYDERLNFEIIGFVQTSENFIRDRAFQSRPPHFNSMQAIFELEHFTKETLEAMNLKSLNGQVLFDIDPSIYDDFDLLKAELDAKYFIHFDNAYISIFNLNNYLDILHNGVYVSRDSTHSHEGLVVLLDPDDDVRQDRIVARYTWQVIAGTFTFDFHIESIGVFNTDTIFCAPREVFNEYWNISSGFLTQQAKLELNLKASQDRVKSSRETIERETRRQEQIKKQLDTIKKNGLDVEFY